MPTASEPDRVPRTEASAADAAVEAADRDRLAALDDLSDQPLAAHVEAYESLHAELQHALSEIDGA